MTDIFVATDGNDGNDGTFDHPFATVAKAIDAWVLGDSIYMRGGTYYERIVVNKSGTLVNPLLISRYETEEAIIDGRTPFVPDHPEPVLEEALPEAALNIQGETFNTYNPLSDVIDEALITIQGSYCSLYGLELSYSPGRGVSVGSSVSNASISTCTIHHTAKELVYTDGGGVNIIGSIFHDGCTLNATPDGLDGYGVDNRLNGLHFKNPLDDSSIVASSIFNVHGKSVYVENASGFQITSTRIANSADDAITVKNIIDSVIARNAIYYVDDYANEWRANGIVISDNRYLASENKTSNLSVEFNIVVGCKWGIFHAGGVLQSVFPRQNDNSPQIEQRIPGASTWDDVYVNNNTFVEQFAGNRFARSAQLGVHGDPDDGPCYMSNNIFFEQRGRVLVWERVDIDNYVAANNIYSKRPEQYELFTDLTGNIDSLVGNPDLENPTASIPDVDSFAYTNYRLKTSSVCIDAGLIDHVQTGVDYLGYALNDPPDIGAVQIRGWEDVISVDFSADVTNGDKPLTVQFASLVTSDAKIATVLWKFGDGGSSTEEHPTHVYQTEGLYHVELTVTDINGVTVKKRKESYIEAVYSGTSGAAAQTLVQGQSTPRAIQYDIIDSDLATMDANGNITLSHNLGVEPVFMLIMPSSYNVGAQAAYGVWGDGPTGKRSASVCLCFTDNFLHGNSYVYNWRDESAFGTWISEQAAGGTTKTATGEVVSVSSTEVNLKFYDVYPTDEIFIYLIGGEGIRGSISVGEIAYNDDEIYLHNSGRVDAVMTFASYLSTDDGIGSGQPLIGYGFATREDAHQAFAIGQRHNHDGALGDTIYSIGKVMNGFAFSPLYDYLYVDGEFDGDAFKISPSETQEGEVAIPYIAVAFELGGVPVKLLNPFTPTGSTTDTYDVGFEIGSILGVMTSMVDPTYDTHSNWGLGVQNGSAVGSGARVTCHIRSGKTGGDSTPHTRRGTDLGIELVAYDTGLVESEYYSQISSVTPSDYQIQTIDIVAARIPFALIFGVGAGDNPVADFSMNRTTGYTDVTQFQITDEADPNGIEDLEWEYTLGDGRTVTDQNPSFSYPAPGVYTITQTVTSAGDPTKTSSFSLTVEIVDPSPIANYTLEYAGKNVKVGSVVTLTDMSTPFAGQSIVGRTWALTILKDGELVPVATSTASQFEHLIMQAGEYHVLLSIVQDDGLSGVVTGFFEAAPLTPPVADFEISFYGGEATSYGARGNAPMTIKLVNTSDLKGGELETLEWQILKRLLGRSGYRLEDTVYGHEEYWCTFNESASYKVVLSITTNQGDASKTYTGGILVNSPYDTPIGMPPNQIGTTTRNIHDYQGNHEHEVEFTTEGEPYRLVATDKHGGGVFQKFAINESISTVLKSVKNVVAAIRGKILFAGPGSGLAGDAIAIDAKSFGPDIDVEVDLGTYHDNWQNAHIYNLIASNLVQKGYISSVDGDIFVGQSHDLIRDVAPGDELIYVTDGRRVSLGDYLMFAREELYEVMQVAGDPVEDAIDIDRWLIPVIRGSQVAPTTSASQWYMGDALMNLGGGTNDLGLVPGTWIELLHGRSIDSRIKGSDAEHAPAFIGTLRTGTGVHDYQRYFALGDLRAIYGQLTDRQVPGVALGPEAAGGLHLLSVSGNIYVMNGTQVYLKITPQQGLTVPVGGAESSITDYGLETDDGLDAGSFGGFYDSETGDIVSYVKASNLSQDSKLRLANDSASGSVSIVLSDTVADGRQIIITGIPTTDPAIAGALWNSSGTLMISGG